MVQNKDTGAGLVDEVHQASEYLMVEVRDPLVGEKMCQRWQSWWWS